MGIKSTFLACFRGSKVKESPADLRESPSARASVDSPRQRTLARSAADLSPLAQAKEARQRANDSPVLNRNRVDLGAYIMARSADGRALDAKDVKRLQRADEAVQSARAVLHVGRGNVREDLARTDGQSNRNTRAGRSLAWELSGKNIFGNHRTPGVEHRVAAATLAAAGNCGEFARLSAAMYASKMGTDPNTSGERVHVVASRSADHAWMEVRTGKKGATDIIADAWQNGSAVLAEDAHFGSDRSDSKTSAKFNQKQAEKLRERINHEWSRANEPQHRAHFQSMLDKLDRLAANCREQDRWDEGHVLEEEFTAAVRARLETPAGRFNSLSELLPAEPGEPTPAARRAMLNEVLASGAARQMGASVFEAASVAPAFVRAARTLPSEQPPLPLYPLHASAAQPLSSNPGDAGPSFPPDSLYETASEGDSFRSAESDWTTPPDDSPPSSPSR